MIGIISDIHGNFAALREVLAALDDLGAKRVICLGDIAGYYCQIDECCNELRTRRIPTLMGNHDLYLTSGTDCPRSTSANICLEYQRSAISAENMAWLATAPAQAHMESMHLAHGGWNDPIDEYVTPSASYFAGIEGTTFVSGHTHMPCVWKDEGKIYCNPGSVGQPRDGDPREHHTRYGTDRTFISAGLRTT
jgi:predicted phosphodiesterase